MNNLVTVFADNMPEQGSKQPSSGLSILESLTLNERVSLFFTLASLTFFLLSSALLFSYCVSARQAEARASLAQAITSTVEGVRLSLLDAETKSRGLVLTGDRDIFDLDPNQRANAARQVQELKDLTKQLNLIATAPEQHRTKNVDELGEIVDKKFAFIDLVISNFESNKIGEAVTLVRSGEGKRLMDRGRELVDGLLGEQKTLLHIAEDLRLHATSTIYVISLLSAVLASGLLFGTGLLTVKLFRNKNLVRAREAKSKAVEKALSESNRKFNALTTALSQIVWTANSAGELLYQNRSLALNETTSTGSCGAVGPQVAGSWFELLHPEDAERVKRAWASSVATHEKLEEEFRLKNPVDGAEKWYSVCATAMTDVDIATGKIHFVQWFGTLTDIDSQRKLLDERDMLLAQERAARSNAELAVRLKDEFVATLSHELRTPLNAMLGWIQICQRRKGDVSTWEAALEVLDRNARLQSKLISDLLDSRELTTHKVNFQSVTVDLGLLLTRLVSDFEPTSRAKGVHLSLTLSTVDLFIVGDQQRLAQVFSNLISNGIKFTAAGGTIAIEASLTDAGVRVSISDTGIGMSQDFLKIAFDRYRQANASSSRSYGGLGLGLAIAKSIIDAHGGSIVATSAGADMGSTFTLTLPAFDSTLVASAFAVGDPKMGRSDAQGMVPTPSALQAASASPEVTLAGKRLLVIDDQLDARYLIRELLLDFGVSIELAASGKEGLESVRLHPPDIVICDIGMPEMDGYTVARHMREDPKLASVVLIALTAHTRPEDIALATAAGFDFHLGKPLDAEILISMLCSIASAPSLLKAI